MIEGACCQHRPDLAIDAKGPIGSGFESDVGLQAGGHRRGRSEAAASTRWTTITEPLVRVMTVPPSGPTVLRGIEHLRENCSWPSSWRSSPRSCSPWRSSALRTGDRCDVTVVVAVIAGVMVASLTSALRVLFHYRPH